VPFEAVSQWLPNLELLVVQLARQLQHPSESEHTLLSHSSAFPATLVLEELEEIAATLATLGIANNESFSSSVGSGSRGWVLRCFYDIGMSHGTLVESFMEIFDRWAGKAPEKLLYLLASTTAALLHWTRGASE
jgi:hypothetical protein